MKEGWSGQFIIRFLQCLSPAGVVDLIELDGNPHGEYYKINEDEIRDKYLESYGFTVIRFENRKVFQEPEYSSTTPAAISLFDN